MHSPAESRNTHSLPRQPYLLYGNDYVGIYLCPVSGASPCQRHRSEVNFHSDGSFQYCQQTSDWKIYGPKGECTCNIFLGWQCFHAPAFHVLRENSHAISTEDVVREATWSYSVNHIQMVTRGRGSKLVDLLNGWPLVERA